MVHIQDGNAFLWDINGMTIFSFFQYLTNSGFSYPANLPSKMLQPRSDGPLTVSNIPGSFGAKKIQTRFLWALVVWLFWTQSNKFSLNLQLNLGRPMKQSGRAGTLRPLPQRREMEGSLGLSVAVVFVVLGDGVSVAKRVQGTNVSCKISKSWEILFSWVCLGSGCEIFLGGLRGWNAGKASQMSARRGFTSHCLLRGAFLIGNGPNKGRCKDRQSINVQNEVYNKQRQFFHTWNVWFLECEGPGTNFMGLEQVSHKKNEARWKGAIRRVFLCILWMVIARFLKHQQ